jgi:hypothetical protein
VVKQLEENNCEVFIAGSGASLELLKLEFPGKHFFELPSYGITYSDKLPLLLHLGLRSPKILSAIRREHQEVLQITRAHKINHIISDNRYGCYHPGIPSAMIIHQLSLQLPAFARGLGNYYNRLFIKRFTHCWVPDMPDRRLSGDLSKSDSIAHTFIGPLSRLTPTGNSRKAFHVLAVVSGPEPHRSSFEDLLVRQLPGSGLTYRLVRGLPGEPATGDPNLIPHLPASELRDLIESAEVIVSRSGYSTIMDVAALKKKAIFVPTPGQTEQLYLAREMERKKIAPMVLQKELSLPAAFDRLKDFTGFTEESSNNNLLQATLREFLG